MGIKYCPECGKEIPEQWIKEYELLLMPDTVGVTELHCFDCGVDFEITNKTVTNKRISKYYKDLEINTRNPLFDRIVQKNRPVT